MKAAAPTTIAELAQYILSPECRRIAVLTGAGVSVAANIPDFRSPGGMYDTLQPERLTASQYEKRLMESDPTYVVSWEIFRKNPFPYMEVRRPFILGTQQHQWKATIAHRFFELLEVHQKMQRLYTQNIDGLDFQCDKIPENKIVPVHGSLGIVQCEGCGEFADYETFCERVRTQIKDIYGQDEEAPRESTPILCEHCEQPLVKPATVLFGRSLPTDFFHYRDNDSAPDLLLIAGTSLQVSPANSLVNTFDSAIRILVNREMAGAELDFGSNYRDNFFTADCDDFFLQLIVELGWLDELPIELLPDESKTKAEKARQENAYKNWF